MLVAVTVVLTVYGQIIIKWQTNRAGELPSRSAERVDYLLHFMVNPWVISSFVAAAVAALAYIGALSKLELSRAYPFMATSFVLVLFLSALFFGEELTVAKVLGVALIVLGLIVGSQSF